MSYILALDQGTTSSRAILFDRAGQAVASGQQELAARYPQPGWVEQDPLEIYASQMAALHEALVKSGRRPSEIAGIGITNQRETTVVWNRRTGVPVCPALVWQCRRTAEICERWKAQGLEPLVKERTGLRIDAYFSASKIRWILDTVPGAREQADRGDLLFGTVDTWLIWKMTGGRVHCTDYTNASRTLLFNIHTRDWDDQLPEALGIPRSMLPRVCRSSEVYGTDNVQGTEIPIAGAAGDQQAALFGQCCFEPGQGKTTYGTGCFLLMNTGETACDSDSGLLTTVGIGLRDRLQYAVEGSVFVGGAVVQWLRDEMHLIHESCDVEYFSQKVPDTGGVYFVPAFTGLGAPYWDMYARGAIFGITRGTRREHLIRAAVESTAYQTGELIEAVRRDTGLPVREMRVDGGAARDNFLLQFQADISGICLRRPAVRESTARGAAFLAGLATGVWSGLDELAACWKCEREFLPQMEQARREELLHNWQKAVERCRGWSEAEMA